MKQHTRRVPAKGTSRRVVIVPGDDNGVFEQIIYVVRDDLICQQGVSADEVLRQAQALLRAEPADEEESEPPAVFSRAVLILVLIALALTATLLIVLALHGWL